MFYYKESVKESTVNRSDELRKANEAIQKSIEENLIKIAEKLKKSDIPVEEHDEILTSIRRKTQIKMIGIFKEELKKNSKP